MKDELEYRIHDRLTGKTYEVIARTEQDAHRKLRLTKNVSPAEQLSTIAISQPTPYIVPIDPMDGLECEGCQ